MAIKQFHPADIFHILGQGWYVENPLGIKGPFALRHHAERYLAALAIVVESSDPVSAQQSFGCGVELIVEPGYYGTDRRLRPRRGLHDRRSLIRFDAHRSPRRSEWERRAAAQRAHTERNRH